MARHAFDTLIPLSVDSSARKQIIFDFFDLLAAISARAKSNGLGGRKLSRMAGWWAFEHSDDGKGFDGGYRSWAKAADATSHLYFAYLRSLSPDAVNGVEGISALPRSLQALLSQTEYPPETPTLMYSLTTRVVMIVDTVSPSPFALLRRAKNFEYRDDDRALQKFSSYEDPVQALTEECRRVLNAISLGTEKPASNLMNGHGKGAAHDASWSRFEDMGFGNLSEGHAPQDKPSNAQKPPVAGLRSGAESRTDDFGRPTTPSWADFMNSGFKDEKAAPTALPMSLPADKVLPLIGENDKRGHSSQSHVRNDRLEQKLEPGELASIARFDLDDTFWWVWMMSLAAEEPPERKAVFGRCALIETVISGAHWLVIEEQVKGASPDQEEGIYVAEKKSRFSFTRRGRRTVDKKVPKRTRAESIKEPYDRNASTTPLSKRGIDPNAHAKIQAAAARLKMSEQQPDEAAQRRARLDEQASVKTNSVLTLQPLIISEAAPAMKWAKEFDKGAIRDKYLRNPEAGTGRSTENLLVNGSSAHLSPTYASPSPDMARNFSSRDLPALPPSEVAVDSPRAETEDVQHPSSKPLPMPSAADGLSIADSEPAQTPLPHGIAEKPAIDETITHPAYRAFEEVEQASSPDSNLAQAAAKAAMKKKRASDPPLQAKLRSRVAD